MSCQNPVGILVSMIDSSRYRKLATTRVAGKVRSVLFVLFGGVACLILEFTLAGRVSLFYLLPVSALVFSMLFDWLLSSPRLRRLWIARHDRRDSTRTEGERLERRLNRERRERSVGGVFAGILGGLGAFILLAYVFAPKGSSIESTFCWPLIGGLFVPLLLTELVFWRLSHTEWFARRVEARIERYTAAHELTGSQSAPS